MWKRRLWHSLVTVLFIAVLLLASQWQPQPARAADPDPSDFAPGEILVKFIAATASTPVDAARAVGATRVRTLYGTDVELWRVPVGEELTTIARLNARRDVAYAEVNGITTVFGAPDDTYYGYQWAHSKIGSPAAWDVSTGSSAFTIAIIDTGIDETHPDLASKIVAGYDFVDNDSNPHDTNGHGTHVAGIAAALTNNARGVAGMDWYARIMPIRVLGYTGSGYTSDITAGILWAANHGADVINLSLGGKTYSQAMQDAINAAHAARVLVVAAMGNCRYASSSCGTTPNPTSYPAAMTNVFAVAATASDDLYANYSQFGSHCDIAAPGGEMSYYGDPGGILSTMPSYSVYLTTVEGFGQNYDRLQGTSMAAPLVSGLAALVWSENPAMSPDQVQAIIEDTAVERGTPGWDVDHGHGRINAAAAMLAANAHKPVMDLKVTNAVTSTGVLTATLGWTPPVTAMTITLRWDDSPITEANWSAANPFAGPLPGNASSRTKPVPYTGGWAYFALKSQTADGTWSPLSVIAFWPSRETYIPMVTRN